MKKSEFFACAQFLANWPDGCSFDDVLAGVDAGDLAYVIDPDYRGWRESAIAWQIELTERAFSRAVADILNPQKTSSEELNSYFGDVSSQLAALTIRK